MTDSDTKATLALILYFIGSVLIGLGTNYFIGAGVFMLAWGISVIISMHGTAIVYTIRSNRKV